MKITLILLLVLSSQYVFAQELVGNWNGKFIDKKVEYPISLKIILKPGNIYEITSTSQTGQYLDGERIMTVCTVSYKLSQDSIKLKEIAVVGKNQFHDNCFQQMNLKIIRNKKRLELSGEWLILNEECKGSGKISFWKQRNS